MDRTWVFVMSFAYWTNHLGITLNLRNKSLIKQLVSKMKENKNSDLYLCFSMYILKNIFVIQIEISSFIRFIICATAVSPNRPQRQVWQFYKTEWCFLPFLFVCLLSAHCDILRFTNAQLSEFNDYIILNDKIFVKLWVFFK